VSLRAQALEAVRQLVREGCVASAARGPPVRARRARHTVLRQPPVEHAQHVRRFNLLNPRVDSTGNAQAAATPRFNYLKRVEARDEKTSVSAPRPTAIENLHAPPRVEPQ
jgi:hypothetical protein